MVYGKKYKCLGYLCKASMYAVKLVLTVHHTIIDWFPHIKGLSMNDIFNLFFYLGISII